LGVAYGIDSGEYTIDGNTDFKVDEVEIFKVIREKQVDDDWVIWQNNKNFWNENFFYFYIIYDFYWNYIYKESLRHSYYAILDLLL